MTKWMLIPAAVVVFLAACSGERQGGGQVSPAGGKGAIEVHVSGLRNAEGHVLVSLFASPEGFPGSSDQAMRSDSAPARPDGCTVTFEDIAWGSYAVSVLHDENDDGSLDRGLLGIPTEGYGVSRSPEPGMGQPAYEDAEFSLDSELCTLEVEVTYRGGD